MLCFVLPVGHAFCCDHITADRQRKKPQLTFGVAVKTRTAWQAPDGFSLVWLLVDEKRQ